MFVQDDIMAAEPQVEERIKKSVSNHKWMPPGYKASQSSQYAVYNSRLIRL